MHIYLIITIVYIASIIITTTIKPNSMSKIIIKSIPIITTSHAKMLRISSTAIQNLHCQCDLQHQGPDHLREVF